MSLSEDETRNRITNKDFDSYDVNLKALKQITTPLAMIIDDYSTANITYFCYAEPGTDPSDSSWQIKIIDETGNYPIFKYADGNSEYDNVADDRTTLSYS